MTQDLKQLHDQLLEAMPEGANHNPVDCPVCTSKDVASLPTQPNNNTPGGGAMSEKTHTEDDVNEAVAKATADLATEVAELRASLASRDAEAEVAKAVETVTSEKDAEIAGLQSELDKAVLAAEEAKTELAALTTFIQEEADRAEHEAEKAARRDERLAKIKAVASFPEDHVAKSIDRWTAMSDEDFEAQLADWAAAAKKVEGESEVTDMGEIARETAFQGERTTGGAVDRLSATKEVLSMAVNRTDLRSL